MSAVRADLTPHRRAMIAKVHLGAKMLGLDEGARRDLMERITRRRSATDLTASQLADVLDEYRRLGWPAANDAGASPAARRPRPADHPVAKKARAMWISLYQLGVVRDRRDSALEAFARKQLKVEQFQWADQAQGFRLIEALKAMAERAGWSQDVAGVAPADQVAVLKGRLEVLLQRRRQELEQELP